jgi:hypothetical protein
MKLPNMPLNPYCIPLRSMQSGERGHYPTVDRLDPYAVQKVKTPDFK